MAITKRDMERIAQGFKYIAEDPAADHSTLVKAITEFSNAADSINPRFDRAQFNSAIFGGGHAVINPWSNKRIECGACGYDLFWSKGRTLDYFKWECQRCFHPTQTMTETGMSA